MTKTKEALSPAEQATNKILRRVKGAGIHHGNTINFAIITSEYCTAISVATTLSQVMGPLYQDKIRERLTQLETATRNELMLCFNVETKVGQLATTPIYEEDHFKLLTEYYVLGAERYELGGPKDGMRDLALCRQQSKITYFANAPIFKIAELLKSDSYLKLLKSDISDEDLLLLYETLTFVYLLESGEYKAKINEDLHMFSKEVLDSLNLGDVLPE